MHSDGLRFYSECCREQVYDFNGATVALDYRLMVPEKSSHGYLECILTFFIELIDQPSRLG